MDKPKRILIVDDMEANLELLEAMLVGSGYEVKSAGNGIEALEKLKSDSFDMIISDILMPKMDGFQLCRECKSNDTLRKVPFVFYTATYTDKNDEEFALNLGVDRFLIKPMELDRFMEIIRDVLKNHKNGLLAPPEIPTEKDETVILKKYNERLINKLEKKMLDLEKEIAQRKRSEKALKESEAELFAIYNDAPITMILVDEDRRVLKANQLALDFTERQYDEIVGLRGGEALRCIHATDPAGCGFGVNCEKCIVRNTVLDSLKTGNAHHNIEAPVQLSLSDGVVDLYFMLSTSPLNIAGKKSVLVCLENITEHKQAEEALRESEARYRELVENAVLGIFRTTQEGKFIMANQRMADIFGYDSQQHFLAEADNIIKLYANPEERPRVLKEIDEKGYIDGKEGNFKRMDGSPIFCNAYVRSIQQKDGETIYEGLLEDITEQKSLEDQLHRAQKMEAMGLMAGGIAHDLNNILSGIVSYPELLLMDIPVDSPMRKPMETIQESGMRAADVVTDLMTIARGVAISKEVLNFNTVVEEYLNSIEHKNLVSIRPSVTFKTQFDSDLLNINGSPTHIKKTLMNLVINASVTISTMNQYLDEPLRGYEDVVTGEYIVLTVSDDGLGISQQDLERIFEPFYTKKVMDRSGTGLGLAVVWNTVQDHKGYINVKSSEKGTVFELYFPVTREEVAAEEEEVSTGDYLGHGEKILVVDDEERQREIASGILTRLGYNSETVSSGEEAIEYVKENAVDLIVLDMVMPKGINGRKTYQEIIKIHPEQKAIIASGYAKTKEVDMAQELGAGKYIKKPYTLKKVGLAVKEELEK
ncbi:MAG: response regulator [Deltaproteobacteria bacterium]|nr:response regulator [Deltaproteobacteria bacterium]